MKTFYLVIFFFLSQSCASTLTKFTTAPSNGGLPVVDAVTVSESIVMVRAQKPESPAEAVYEVKSLEEGKNYTPYYTLSGKGKSKGRTVKVKVYLDKQDYRSGYLMVSQGKGSAEKWRIVSYQQTGRSDSDTFDFIYVLATPNNELRYFAILGRVFDSEGQEYANIEGALFYPRSGKNFAKWEQSYKIVFGSKIPTSPGYKDAISQTSKNSETIADAVSELVDLREKIQSNQTELAEVKAQKVEPGDEASHKEKVTELETTDKELTAQMNDKISATRGFFVNYYDGRSKVATSYADFYRSNLCNWATLSAQAEYFENWKEVEGYDDKVRSNYDTFLGFSKQNPKVKKSMTVAEQTIRKNNNAQKNPSVLATPTDEKMAH